MTTKATIFISLLVLFTSIKIFSQAKENYYTADSLLRILLQEYKNPIKSSTSYNYSIEGNEYIYGHNNTPEKADLCPLKGEMSFLTNGSISIKSGIVYGKDSYQSSTLFFGDSCYFIDYGETKTVKLNKFDLMFVYMYTPIKIIESMQSNKTTLHVLQKNNVYTLGFNDKNGNKYYVSVNKDNLITKVEKYMYDDIYGDVSEELVYSNYKKTSNNIRFAERIIYTKGTLVQRELKISFIDIKIDSVLIKEQFKNENSSKIGAKISIDTIGKKLYLLKLNNLNNKILVIECKDFISVVEAPINLETGREIISKLKEMFPLKPIKYCFIGHHHPDHAGAVSAFMEINAKIISTKGNLNFYKKIASGRHTLNQKQNKLILNNFNNFETIDLLSNKLFFEGDNPIQVFEFGKNTLHTDEFLGFYFPKANILFVGDLVLFPMGGEIMPQDQRAYSVYKLIKENKLNVSKIYTAWPLHDYRDFGTMTDLINCIKGSFPQVK